MAHSQAAYQRLGQMLAHLKQVDLEAVADMYIAELDDRAGAARHAAPARERPAPHHGSSRTTSMRRPGGAFLPAIEAYRREEVVAGGAITLLRQHLRRHPDPYMDSRSTWRRISDKLALRGSI